MSDVLPSTDRLDEAVRAVAGVDTLYSAGPLLSNVIATAVEAVTGHPRSDNSVLVAQRKAGVSVAVKIGVTAPYAATDVCRRVHDAIANELDQPGSPPVAEIAVTVARIG